MLGGLFERTREVPLGSDGTDRLLPWVVALMVFLAVLAIVGALMLVRAVGSLTAGLTGTLTIHLPTGAVPAAEADGLANRAALVLRRQRGVVRVRVLNRDHVARLIGPWAGPDTADLPLPRLLDVSLARGARVNLTALRRVMRSIVPGATVVDHQNFVGGFLNISQWLFIGGLCVAALVLAATMLTIVFATRTSLRIHRHITDVLSLIGARDSYVAGQFERHAFRQGLIGGGIGTLAAALTLAVIAWAVGGTAALSPTTGMIPIWMWVLVAVFPLLAAFLARFTARFTVLRDLAKGP